MNEDVPFPFAIYVGNLPNELKREDLGRLLGADICSASVIEIVRDGTGASKGFGFCRFRERVFAEEGIRRLEIANIDGRTLIVHPVHEGVNGDPNGNPSVGEVDEAVKSLPPELTHQLLLQMQTAVVKKGQQTRAMLEQNPRLALALLRTLVLTKIVSEEEATGLVFTPTPVEQLLAQSQPQGPQPFIPPGWIDHQEHHRQIPHRHQEPPPRFEGNFITRPTNSFINGPPRFEPFRPYCSRGSQGPLNSQFFPQRPPWGPSMPPMQFFGPMIPPPVHQTFIRSMHFPFGPEGPRPRERFVRPRRGRRRIFEERTTSSALLASSPPPKPTEMKVEDEKSGRDDLISQVLGLSDAQLEEVPQEQKASLLALRTKLVEENKKVDLNNNV